MKNLLNFFLEVEKLKTMPRTGWVLMEVKNPETIAEHTFRMTILSWLLAQKKNFNIKKTILTAFFHDLCEVYAGDVTPFFYYLKLPKDKAQRKKFLMRWIRLSKKEKEKLGKRKFNLEKDSLSKITRFVKSEIKRRICSYWFDFEKKISKEGKFVKQVDRIETLIQSIEYFGTKEETGGSSWWEGTEEMVEDPLLLNFLKVIQEKFYGKMVGKYKKDKELDSVLDFLIKINKLKKMPRTLWLSMGVKNPETVAGHIFTTTLMTWVFGVERKEIDLKKSLEMALCHEMPAVYTGDLVTPFSKLLPKEIKERRKIFEKWPRFSKEDKEKIFGDDYKKEKRAMEKLTQKLSSPLKKEIISLWDEYKTNLTSEARFVNQINVLAVLLQALLYQKKDKNLPIGWIWEWAFEKCDCPFILEFLEIIKGKFYKKSLIQRALFKFLGSKYA